MSEKQSVSFYARESDFHCLHVINISDNIDKKYDVLNIYSVPEAVLRIIKPMCLCVCVCTRTRALSRFSHVQLFTTLWTVTHQAPLSMGFSRQEYWSGLPFPVRGSS